MADIEIVRTRGVFGKDGEIAELYEKVGELHNKVLTSNLENALLQSELNSTRETNRILISELDLIDKVLSSKHTDPIDLSVHSPALRYAVDRIAELNCLWEENDSDDSPDDSVNDRLYLGDTVMVKSSHRYWADWAGDEVVIVGMDLNDDSTVDHCIASSITAGDGDFGFSRTDLMLVKRA